MCVEQNEAAEESPSAFVAALTAELEAAEGVDSDVAAILKRHLLKTDPTDSAVSDALAAIKEIAEARIAKSLEDQAGANDAESDLD